MANFVELAPLDQVPPGTAIVARIGDTTVALFHVGGRVLAIGDACIRCGSSLAQGSISGERVTCPQCSWRYDLATGQVVGIPKLRIDRFHVKAAGGRILFDRAAIPYAQWR
jgi:nitrite reductase/ring-hydroxylating ferredoxin subunit